MVVVSRLAAACFIIFLPIFLITSNVRILASNADYYQHGFRKYQATQATGIPLADLDRAAGQIIDYFEDDSTSLRIIVSEDGQETSLFNARETEHMKDVKTLMRFVYRLNEVSLAIVLTYVGAVFLWSREKSLRTLAAQAIAGVGVGFAAIAAVGVFALTGFDQTWTRFHELVFSNDLWKLNPATDHLIQMFPEKFWQEATYLVGGLTLAEALVVVVTATAYLLFARGPKAKPTGKAPATAPTAASDPAPVP